MKVLLITGSYPPMKCGVGDYSCKLAKALAANPQIQVAILTSAIDGATDINDKIEVFRTLKKWSLAETFKAAKVIFRWTPDIVHIQFPTQGYRNGLLPWILPIILFLTGKKVVQTWHEGFSNWRRLLLIAMVPDVLVTVYPSYKELLHPKLRWVLLLKKCELVPIASNIPVIDMSESQKNILKKKYLKDQKRLVVFFGFVYPHKGVELLFEIADPSSDQIVIAGEFDSAQAYNHRIIEQASSKPWIDKVTITGFLPPDKISELLTVADAVILPFRTGQGEWNRGSVYAAVTHKTFVITTSKTRNGYDQKRNIYYAKVDNVQEMKSALCNYAGSRREKDAEIDKDEWQEIANKHIGIYKRIISPR
jgi:glycosyltransferase involved in cell wall biosynthesis